MFQDLLRVDVISGIRGKFTVGIDISVGKHQPFPPTGSARKPCKELGTTSSSKHFLSSFAPATVILLPRQIRRRSLRSVVSDFHSEHPFGQSPTFLSDSTQPLKQIESLTSNIT